MKSRSPFPFVEGKYFLPAALVGANRLQVDSPKLNFVFGGREACDFNI
jgi:hypothetical protein